MRYFFDKKYTVEESRCLSLVDLKRLGYFCGAKAGTIKWTNRWQEESKVSIEVVTLFWHSPYVRLNYFKTDEEGNKKEFDYQVPLVTTPCRYGGLRYWFCCPLVKKGGCSCNRRVFKIFLPPEGKYFGCRHCYDLTYQKRQEHSKNYDFYQQFFDLKKDIDRLKNEIKYRFYRGVPNKKYRQYLEALKRHEIYAPFIFQGLNTLLSSKK